MPRFPWLRDPEGRSVNAGLEDAELVRESNPGARASLKGPSPTQIDLSSSTHVRTVDSAWPGLPLVSSLLGTQSPAVDRVAHHRPSIIPSSGILPPGCSRGLFWSCARAPAATTSAPALSTELHGSRGRSLQYSLGQHTQLSRGHPGEETVVTGCPGAWHYSFPRSLLQVAQPC